MGDDGMQGSTPCPFAGSCCFKNGHSLDCQWSFTYWNRNSTVGQTQLFKEKRDRFTALSGPDRRPGTICALKQFMAMVSSTISNMDIKNPEASSADQKLVERCLQGDDAAWEAIVSSFAGRIFRMSYRYTERREEAEDLTQEIFIRIYQNLRSFRADTGSFQNWALRLSRNLIIDRYRQARRFQQCGGSQELDAMHLEDHSRPSPQRRMEQAEASVLIRRALHALSPESKEAIILRDLARDGLSGDGRDPGCSGRDGQEPHQPWPNRPCQAAVQTYGPRRSVGLIVLNP